MKISLNYIKGLGDLATKTILGQLLPKESKFVDIVHTDADVNSTCKVDLKIPQFTPGMDALQGRYVRAHVDNLFHNPCPSRVDSPRRIGINLGPGARWLLLGVPDILEIARDRGLQPDDVPRTKHFADYVLDRPYEPVPCLWIRQLPGEAYIVPTELAIHDGSTLGEYLESTMAFWTWHAEVGILPSTLTSAANSAYKLEQFILARNRRPYKGNSSIFTMS